LYGGQGEINYYDLDESTQRLVLNFTPEEGKCGLEFDLRVDYLLYSPALMDDKAVQYKLEDFKPEKIYLSLPNGLICIKENIYIIKHNEFVSLACCIDRKSSKLRFEIENPQKQKLHWVLTLFKGELQDAIDLASRINISPIVCL
jgi:hypothetical protein